MQLYQQMASHDEELSSPPNSPAADANSADFLSIGSRSSSEDERLVSSGHAAINSSKDDGLSMNPPPALDSPWSNIYSGLYSPDVTYSRASLPTGRYGFMTPPIRPVNMPAPKIGGSYVTPGESSLNSLELEAIAAVHELQFAVKDIFVSELLPRTSELIFLNITTLEGQAYCIELTMKGWRVTSLRHDCMNGDFAHINLHTRYFETIYALMDNISDNYRRKFSEALSAKLQILQNFENVDEAALAKAFEQNAVLKNNRINNAPLLGDVNHLKLDDDRIDATLNSSPSPI